MTVERIEKIPERIVLLSKSINFSGEGESLLRALTNLQTKITELIPLFNIEQIGESISLAELLKLHRVMILSSSYQLSLFNSVKSFLTDEASVPRNINELNSDVRNLSELSRKFQLLKKQKIENILCLKNPEIELLNKLDFYKEIYEDCRKILLHASLIEELGLVKIEKIGNYLRSLEDQLLQWKSWESTYSKLLTEINRLFENEHSIDQFEDLNFEEFGAKIALLILDKEGLEKWITYRRYAFQLEKLGYGWFLEDTKHAPLQNPASVFACSLWNEWLGQYYKDNPELQEFSLTEQQKIIDEFKILEKNIFKVNADRILGKLAPKVAQAKRAGADLDLVRQSQLQQRHKPIRKLVREYGAQLMEYKPCWMMSPLTLSSYIPYGTLTFDTVIFDEASQMRVEHALGSMARAKQLIIFGDENQLPPTSFFEIKNDIDEDDEADPEDYESVLHATKGMLKGADLLLSHHYRSKYEDLIAFSNHFVYKDELITFPNPNNKHRAVQMEYVENGVFDGGKNSTRRNIIEAKRVIELCVKQVIDDPEKSLGIIAFSKSQEEAIRQSLLDFLKTDPDSSLQEKLNEDAESDTPFFIKSLESVQGDERDVIILSVGYGRDMHGNMYNRFGPINGTSGYRRLNVAVTRAKEKIICVSSMKATDIHNAEKSRGAKMLRDYLEYAEHGVQMLQASRALQEQNQVQADSDFEIEVEQALVDRGYKVHRQVGVSGFRIDLAILNPNNLQEYILGIECDGASYHSSYSARMNDRFRQEILERLGWNIYRVWSQHWLAHREKIIEDIIKVIHLNS